MPGYTEDRRPLGAYLRLCGAKVLVSLRPSGDESPFGTPA